MIARDRTAIRRNDLSRPIRTALSDGMLSPQSEIFDYGCGHGDDIRLLEEAGFRAFGWDPAHKPDGLLRPAEVVNLGYVVNVVEDPQERSESLRSAWKLAGRILIVAARLKSDQALKAFDVLEDGYLTRLQTFQKFFDQQELRDWIESVTNEAPVAAAPGIFYIFKHPEEREQFVASRYRRRIAAPRIRLSDRLFEKHESRLQSLLTFMTDRGRLPELGEIENGEELTSIFGSVRRAFQVVRRVTGEEHWQIIAKERQVDLLVYIALGRFPRRPPFFNLPRDLQRDLRAFFRTYKAAVAAGDALLFEAGNMATINGACSSSVLGKLMPSALYIHVTGLSRLAPVLRVYEGCARVLTGQIAGATIIKMRRDEPKISYLSYPEFDTEAHPALESSVRVDLRSFDIKSRQFGNSDNPPVLHRKELFVPKDYPNRDVFDALTREEVKVGLLNESQDIGLRNQWNEILKRNGLNICGHNLVPGEPGRMKTGDCPGLRS
jgi:DNA phosphorothioation-associated putative methyltransferase